MTSNDNTGHLPGRPAPVLETSSRVRPKGYVTTATELDTVLDALADCWHGTTLALLYIGTSTRRASLDVCLDGNRQCGVLIFSTPRGTWYSHGTATPPGRPAYFNLDDETLCDVHPDSEIPLTDIRRAAHEFLNGDGRRPSSVTWLRDPQGHDWYPERTD